MPGQAELLVRSLEARGERVVRVWTNLGTGPLAQRLDRVQRLRSVLRLPLFCLRLLLALPRVGVVHVFSHSGLGFFLFTAPSVLLGRLFRRRVIVNFHSGDAEPFFAAWPRLTAAVLRLAHVIVVPSGFLVGVFAKRGFPSVVVPNICELDRFSPPQDGPLRPTFVVARHLEPKYNCATVLRGFARIHAHDAAARLEMLGDGSERKVLERLAEELGVAQAVRFSGYVPNERLPERFREASIFLNASRVDNMPISILEAFAAGLPVVSSNAGGIPFMVDHGTTGLLFDPEDDAALAHAALALLSDTARARQMTRAAAESAKQYRWEAIYPKWRELYHAERGA
jgi:L-malate glycosyltransferase